MDGEPPELVWQVTAKGAHVVYPADAPALRIGIPYQVQVSRGGTPVITAVFSIDPDLDVPDDLMTRVVPIGR